MDGKFLLLHSFENFLHLCYSAEFELERVFRTLLSILADLNNAVV